MRLGPKIVDDRPVPDARPRMSRPALLRRAAVLLLPVLGTVALASPAAAQVFELEADVIGEWEYDSNVLRLPDDADPQDGSSRWDVISTYGLEVDGAANFGMQQLYVSAGAARELYLKNDDLDRTNYDAEAGLNWRVTTACSGTVLGTYTEQRSDFEETLEVTTNTQTTVGARAEGGCRFFGYYRPELAVFYRSTDNSLEQQRFTEVDERGVTARLLYSRENLSGAGIEVTVTDREYPNRPANDPVLLDQVTQIDTAVLFNRRLTGKAEARVAIGAATLDGPDDGGPFFLFSGALDWAVTPKLGALFTVERQVGVSDAVESNLRLETSGDVALTYEVSPKTDAVLGFTYTRRSYEGATATAGGSDHRDTSYDINLDGSWAPRDFIDVTAGVGYLMQDSTVSRGNFDGYHVTTGVVISF